MQYLSRTVFFFLSLLLIFSGCSSSSIEYFKAVDQIKPEEIKKHVVFLSSDSLKGRATPSPELDSAANYIAREFSSYGLTSLNGSFLQKISFGKVDLALENHFRIRRNGKEKDFRIKNDFMPFEMTANKDVEAPVVFAGYGITAPEYKYDDYSNIDVKGKIVFILRHEPQENEDSSIFNGSLPSVYSQIEEKVNNARRHGAIALMVVTDPLNHSSLKPQGFPWPSLSSFIPKEALPMTLIEPEDKKIPVIQVGEDAVFELFGSVDSLTKLQRQIDNSLSAKSFELTDCRASIKTSTEIMQWPSYNVAGFLEGSDPVLKNEVVIVGAHYDHIGFKKNHRPGSDYIFNGADDNASGTSGMISLAKAFSSMPQKPKRSILFIGFAGEEIGLLGSKYYTENPLIPLEKTCAMLNMDMIGRNSPDTLYIVGKTCCPDLIEINKLENEKTGFILDYSQEKYLPYSDQASFLKMNIPIIFLHTGEHKDYHKESDEAPLLDYNKAAKVTKLAFYTVLHLANDNKHYKILNNKVTFF